MLALAFQRSEVWRCLCFRKKHGEVNEALKGSRERNKGAEHELMHMKIREDRKPHLYTMVSQTARITPAQRQLRLPVSRKARNHGLACTTSPNELLHLGKEGSAVSSMSSHLQAPRRSILQVGKITENEWHLGLSTFNKETKDKPQHNPKWEPKHRAEQRTPLSDQQECSLAR